MSKSACSNDIFLDPPTDESYKVDLVRGETTFGVNLRGILSNNSTKEIKIKA